MPPSRVTYVLPTRFGMSSEPSRTTQRTGRTSTPSRHGLGSKPCSQSKSAISTLLQRRKSPSSSAASFAASLVGTTLIVDAVLNPLDPRWAWLYVIPFVLALALYRFAADAAERWGAEVRASVDHHRSNSTNDSASNSDEPAGPARPNIASAVTNLLHYGITPPPTVWLGPSPDARSVPADDETMK